MRNKLTQRKIILNQLRNNGFVTRNWALSQYISRLGAIILTLKKEGMNIEAEWKEGDYVYTLKDKPKYTEVYRVNGEIIHTKKVY